MKGALDIEFLLALAIFIGTISFILTTITGRFPLLQEANDFNNVASESYRISDLLMYSQGDTQWERASPEAVNFIGLSSGNKFRLSGEKINALNRFCNQNLIKLYSMFSEKDVIEIEISDMDGNTLAQCKGAGITNAVEFTATRVAIVKENNKVVTVKVKVSR